MPIPVIPTITSLGQLQKQLNDILGQLEEPNTIGYWSPLVGGTIAAPSLVFTKGGDTVQVWTPL